MSETREQVWVRNDYPTSAALKRIKKWLITDLASTGDAMAFAASIWHWPHLVSNELSAVEAEVANVTDGEVVWRFATGGWSGNESIIDAMQGNMLLWMFTWRLSASGGLYIFRVRE